MKAENNALVTIENLEYILAHTHDLIVLKDLRDQAEAVRQYVRQAKQGLELQNRVAELKIRIERQIGQYLNEVVPSTGGRPRKNPATESQFLPSPTLAELEIAPHQARRWRLEADLPENIFDEFVDLVKSAGEELTSAGVRRLAQKWKDHQSKEAQSVETTCPPPAGFVTEPLYLDAYLSLWPGEAASEGVLTANTVTVTVYDGSQPCRIYILEPAEGYSLKVTENAIVTLAAGAKNDHS